MRYNATPPPEGDAGPAARQGVIRTSPKITVHHLQVFLSRKLGWGNSEEFEILYLTGDEKVVKLDGSVSVEDVKNYMGGRGDVLFHFRIG